ncbi:MAG: hypothetical protein FJW90_08960 [Actinobacteria bacterium]|nr:hypothetical protein [Actinomycetota bacterium]
MAARRLLVIMLVLLGISTVAAALVGNRPLNEGRTGTIGSETTGTAPAATAPADAPPAAAAEAAAPRGKRVGVEISAKGDEVKVIPVRLGDQLALTVSSPKADQVELPALGLLEPVVPGAPASFDVLARRRGDYGVRLVFADRLVARIEVTKKQRPGS